MNFVKKIYFILIGLLGLHLFLLVNLQFTAWPEMFSYPFLHNNGYLLYKDMVHPYPPVLTLGLGILYKLFGYKLVVLKLATWVMILVNDILIFLIVKKLTAKDIFALLSLIFYLATQPFLGGNQLWFDLAIVAPILFGTLFFLDKKYFLSGLFLGVTALTKQTAGLYLVFGILYLVFRRQKISKLLSFVAGPTILFLILLARLTMEGAISGFFNWTVIYPFTYWSKFPGYVQMILTQRDWLIVFLLSLPFFASLFLKKKFFPRSGLFVLNSYFLISLIMVYPRFSFFHLQLAIAFSAILFGVFLKTFRVNFLLPSAYFLVTFVFVSLPSLRTNWQKETRFWGTNDLSLAQTIQREVAGSVYLLGPHSALYGMSSKLPPKPWADNFGWYFEVPGVQEEIIRRWEQNPPGVVVWQEPLNGNRFDLGTYQPQKIVKWIKANYNKEEEIKEGVWLWRKK